MDDEEFSLELVAGAGGFGDGEHPTTRLAMQALHALAAMQHYHRILDMGCGSGLLAMTAAHLWPQARVLAVDVEQSAVDITRQNVAHNGFAARITTLRSEGYRHADVKAAAPYDLILCNITADPILGMAKDAKAVLAEGGLLVLAGILRWRSEEVLAVHAQQGIHPAFAALGSGEWDTHILEKTAAA